MMWMSGDGNSCGGFLDGGHVGGGAVHMGFWIDFLGGLFGWRWWHCTLRLSDLWL